MTIGIYCIEHSQSGKKYIGKSSNIEHRFWCHKNLLVKSIKSKDCNRHLYNAVQKYGIENFKFYVLQIFDSINEEVLKSCELLWMDTFKTCERAFGYNLRRDSATKTFVQEETKKLQSIIHSGENNANYGNRWNDEQKLNMSKKAKERHATGLYYTDKTKLLYSEISIKTWSDINKRKQMALAVSKAKEKYEFHQFNLDGILIKIWLSIKDIIKENPEYKWQNIYAVCDGYKPTYRGFKWKKKLKIKS